MTTEQAAAYLPYGLKVITPRHPNGLKISSLSGSRNERFYLNQRWWSDEVKPILHPLSDITKTITVNGESFNPSERLDPLLRMFYNVYVNDWTQVDVLRLPYEIVQQILSWHIDIFNLIESGQAIDVNTLDNNPYA